MWLVGTNLSERTNHLHHIIIEESSDDVTKTKFVKFWDWLAYQERTAWKMLTCQKSSCWCKLIQAIENFSFCDFTFLSSSLHVLLILISGRSRPSEKGPRQSGKKFTLWASDWSKNREGGAYPGSATADRCHPILIATVIYPIKWVNWSKQVKFQIWKNCHMRSFRNTMFQNHFFIGKLFKISCPVM